jgi:prophage antirepressor-like protein
MKEFFKGIRTEIKDNETWFIQKDIRNVLKDYDNYAVILDDDEKGFVPSKKPKKAAKEVVSESGFYKLMLCSLIPQADPFKDWVCGDVLPAIQRDGIYITPALLSDPNNLIPAFSKEKPADRGSMSTLQWVARFVLPQIRKYGCYLTPALLLDMARIDAR